MIDLNGLFHVLSHHRRRHVLYVLRRWDRPLPIEQLSEYVYEMESDAGPIGSRGTSVRTVRNDLVDVHLPELQRHGYVDYDPQTDIVSLTPIDGILLAILDIARHFEMHVV